jgi:biopolymer transport protein ExbD
MRLSNRAKRMIIHQERNRAGASINLIPMIDILSVLVSFLLVYSTEVEVLQPTKALEIPESIAEQKPRETVVVMITREELLVQGEPVAKVADIAASNATIITPLRTALRRPALQIAQGQDAATIASREITILGDKTIPYQVVKKVMATCTESNYGRVSLAVLQKEKAVSASQLAAI